MLRKRSLTIIAMVGYVLSMSAQSGSGSIQGVVRDNETGEPIPFANVSLKNGESLIIGVTTDFDGKYTINYKPNKKRPIKDFLMNQGRFKHLFERGGEKIIAGLQEEVDRRWEELIKISNY